MSSLPNEFTGSTSANLLDGVRRQESGAWVRLSEIYGPLVYRWARQSGLGTEDATDIVQDVFQAVWTSIQSFDRERANASFRGWLWGITRNKLGDLFRRRAIEPQAAGGTDARLRLEQLPDAPQEDSDQASRLNAAATLVQRALRVIENDFSRQTWQAFVRAAIEAHSPADIAADLGMSLAAVYKAKSRVLARLREELDCFE